MTTFPKQYQKIYKQYDKKLLAEHKTSTLTLDNGMDYFVTHLKMLRDYYLLTDPNPENEQTINIKTASLVAAVNEYENYITCITKYYRFNGKVIERITDEPEEETAQKYRTEKNYHWKNFWQLVMTNIEDWSVNG